MARPAPPAHDASPVDPADRGRAFTLELRRQCSGLCGRLTHLASGASAHFDSAEELVTLLLAYGRAGAPSSREPGS